MVLPTLQSYSAVKHLTTPQPIIQTKQEIEAEKKIEKAPTRLNSAQSKWVSPISGILSDEALRNEQEREKKLKSLEQRRSHLSEVLEAEKTKYQNELTSIRQSSRESRPEMKTRTDSLQAARDKSYEHWNTDNSSLNSIEQPRLENLQLDDNWSEPLSEIRLDEYDRHEEERQTEREIRIVQLKIILQRQMNEVKQIEEESKLMKQEEEYLLKEQYQLDQYEEERQQRGKPHVQPDQSRQLLRQHKAKLHKRAKEIQEQLEFDIKILTSITHANEEIRLKQSEQREKFRRDALKMLKQFEQQMKLEKEKEQEFDIMYQEEAAKQWSFREQEWNRENELREKLMRQLLDERQEQIINRLQILKIKLEDAYEKQGTLIADMEQARKYNLIEKQKQAKEREEKKQISIVPQERTQSRLELEKHDTIEDDRNKQIDQLEQKQKSVISNANVESKFYGRRRINWN